MKIECILELMIEKEYISKNSVEEYDCMPKVDRIENKRGKEFGEKLFEAIKQSGEYLIDLANINYSKIEIAKKSDIDNWLQLFSDKEENRIRWSNMRLDSDIFKYIEEKGYKAKKTYNHIQVTNLAIREKRLNKEEEKNQEAIDLLDKLL